MADRIILHPGDVFAGYAIQRLLGDGGMGTVYRAQDPDLPRSVALKLLHRDLTANDYIRSRFELEAAHAARLEHPNIVTVYRRGRENDQLWIAMQFIDSTDASEVVRDGPLHPAQAVHIVTETAKALDHAHAAGVLHRDVKPANILLERSGPGRPGRVLLADFGIAKALAETAQMTQTGMLVASLQYASPEQFDDVDLDARADVYSLGCTLFHLLTGQVPYPGSTLPQLWAGHVKAPIPKPSELRPGLPPALDAVMARAMAKERGDRYPSCGEFASAARAALHSRSTPPPAIVDPDQVDRRPPPVVDGEATTTVHDISRFAKPRQSVTQPPQARDAPDGVFRLMAQVGLILLGALVCATLFTWKVSAVSSWRDTSGNWHYTTHPEYLPLPWMPGGMGYKGAIVATAVVGTVLLFVAVVLAGARQQTAVRLVGVGMAMLVFATINLTLTSSAVLTSTKIKEMQYIALLGAVLLLGGCWRGLSPSKRNLWWLVVSGLATIVLVALVHAIPTHGARIPVLGEGGGGLIAGIALTAAGAALAVRRAVWRSREPAKGSGQNP